MIIENFRDLASRRKGLWCLLTIMSLLSSGCSVGPYVSADTPRPGLVPNESQAKALESSAYRYTPGTTNLETVYVTVGAAKAYGRFLQDAYERALERRALARSGINLGILGTALTALGLKVDSQNDSSVVTLGLIAAGLGIGSQFLLTKDHEAAYSLGAQAIGCVITTATDAEPSTAALTPVEVAIAGYRGKVVAYDQAIARAVAVAMSDAHGALPANILMWKDDAERKLSAAYLNLEIASNYLRKANVLGEQLLNKIEDVRWQVNDAVRRAEPDVLVLNDKLRSQVTAGLSSVGGVIPSRAGENLVQAESTGGHSMSYGSQAVADAVAAADLAGNAVEAAAVDLKKALNDAGNVRVVFSAGAFAGCPFGGGGQQTGRLQVTPADVTIASGQTQQITSVVSGARYASIVTSSLPAGVTAQLAGDTVSVRVPAAAAKAGESFHVLLREPAGSSAALTVRVQQAAAPPTPLTPDPGPPKVPPAAVDQAGPSIPFDEFVKKMQKSSNLHASVAEDGKFGENTRKATIKYMQNEMSEQIIDPAKQTSKIIARIVNIENTLGLTNKSCHDSTILFRALINNPSLTNNPSPTDLSEVQKAIGNIYTDNELISKSEILKDKIIINFIRECNIMDF